MLCRLLCKTLSSHLYVCDIRIKILYSSCRCGPNYYHHYYFSRIKSFAELCTFFPSLLAFVRLLVFMMGHCHCCCYCCCRRCCLSRRGNAHFNKATALFSRFVSFLFENHFDLTDFFHPSCFLLPPFSFFLVTLFFLSLSIDVGLFQKIS